jgi:ArsR family transcriptional regulator, arsenate/arsenite/antimonite-responsive transcriptional repressor
MNSREIVRALGALAHEYRLEVYRMLVREGPEGLPAGAIGERMGLAPSSMTFHLQALHRAGLITRKRASRQLFYSADYAAMSGLVGYLTDECCSAGTASAPDCEPKVASRKPRSANAA